MALIANFIRFLALKKFENRLRFHKVRDSLKVGRFIETQCRSVSGSAIVIFLILLLGLNQLFFRKSTGLFNSFSPVNNVLFFEDGHWRSHTSPVQ